VVVSHARSGGMLGRQVQFWGGEGMLSNIFSPLMGFEIPFLFFPRSSSSLSCRSYTWGESGGGCCGGVFTLPDLGGLTCSLKNTQVYNVSARNAVGGWMVTRLYSTAMIAVGANGDTNYILKQVGPHLPSPYPSNRANKPTQI